MLMYPIEGPPTEGPPTWLPEIVVGPKAPPSVSGTPDRGPLKQGEGQAPQAPPSAQADPWAGFTDKGPNSDRAPEAAAPAPSGADPWAGYTDQGPNADQPKNQPQMTQAGAAARAVESGVTMGWGPVMEGVGAALRELPPEGGGYFYESPAKTPQELKDRVIQAYTAQRKLAEEEQKAAGEQYPKTMLAGEIAGAAAVPLPGLGIARDAGILTRMASEGLFKGAIGGGVQAAGESASEGGSPYDAAVSGASGAGFGGVLGAGAHGMLEGVRSVMGPIWNALRGARNPENEAARRVVYGLSEDAEARGGRPPFTPEEIAAARAAGVPLAIVDTGGETARALLRSAANTSPQGRGAIEDFINSRFASQRQRIADAISRGVGSGDSARDIAALDQLARLQNRPAYAKAYVSGPSVWSPEIERLTASPDLRQAMGTAARNGQSRAVVDGFGAFNPPVTLGPGGDLIFNKDARGLPIWPNTQYWDYVQRELRDTSEQAQRAGRNEEANRFRLLRRQLLDEVDGINPDFKVAREGASGFFGAKNPLDAGRNFVMGMNTEREIGEARLQLARMNPAERELFARGFGLELANKITGLDRGSAGGGQSALTQAFLMSTRSRAKIDLALGHDRADELEALLRVEGIVDRSRKALGNSTTFRQFMEGGLAGVGAATAFETLREGDFNPYHVLVGALTFGGLRTMAQHGAQMVDQQVARRVGEMLVSQDPDVLARGLKIVARSPVMMNALRRAATGAARIAAPHPANVGAGLAALPAIMPQHEPEQHHGEQDFYGNQ